MNTQTIVAIVLAVLAGIAANLMTPYFKRFPSLFYLKFTKRRIASLEKDLRAVRAWRANPTDLYLYLLHVVLWVFVLILIIIMLSIFATITPKFSNILSVMPALIVYVIISLHKTMQLINAVRYFEKYESKILGKLRVLKGKVQ